MTNHVTPLLTLSAVAVLFLIQPAMGLMCHQCVHSVSETTGTFADLSNDAPSVVDEDCKSGNLLDEAATECELPLIYGDRTDIEVFCGHLTIKGSVKVNLFGLKTKTETHMVTRDCVFYDPRQTTVSRPTIACTDATDHEINPFTGIDDMGLADVESEATLCHCVTDYCNGAVHVSATGLLALLLTAMVANVLVE